MQGIPSTLSVPAEAELICVVVAVFQITRGELASTYLTVGVRRRMFLKY